MFRTVGAQPSLFESVLPVELLRLPEELARVDAMLDDPAFFAPFVAYFDPRIGRPSTPMETYLRLMFLKFRYGLGYETLCREVSDSIAWRRFTRIGLEGSVPHPTTLMKLTTRCGPAAVEGLNEALLAKAAQTKLLRTTRVRVDTTVVPSNVAYPTDSGLLARAIRRMAATEKRRSRLPGVRPAPRFGTGPGLRSAGSLDRGEAADSQRGRQGRGPGCGAPGDWRAGRSGRGSPGTPSGSWPTPSGGCVGPGRGPRTSALRDCMTRLRVGAAGGWPALLMT